MIDPLNPPAVLVLGAAAVGRLNWQPRFCPDPLECIASRRGDMLELVFGWDLRDRRHTLAKAARWRYQLDAADNDAGTVTARRIN